MAYEKAAEILLRPETEIERPELLSLVQIHHAQVLYAVPSVAFFQYMILFGPHKIFCNRIPDCLTFFQICTMQCILLDCSGDNSSDKELEPDELEEIISKLKESMQSDIRQAAVWNTLGLILLKSGRLQVQVMSIMSVMIYSLF